MPKNRFKLSLKLSANTRFGSYLNRLALWVVGASG